MKIKYIRFKRYLEKDKRYLEGIEIDIMKDIIIPFLWLILNYHIYLEKLLGSIFQLNLKVPV